MVGHLAQDALAQALQELMEGPRRAEAVGDVGVAAVEDGELLDRGHGGAFPDEAEASES